MKIKWTDERPTEPGVYWLSVAPPNRPRHMAGVLEVEVNCGPRFMLFNFNGDVEAPDADEKVLYVGGEDDYGPDPWSPDRIPISDERFDGAKWSRRETPADPFEVTG